MQESSGWESLATGARVKAAYVLSIGSGELGSGRPTQGSMTSRDIEFGTGEPCTAVHRSEQVTFINETREAHVRVTSFRVARSQGALVGEVCD